MTYDEVVELFDEDTKEFGKFDLVENKLSSRRDLHAFIMLDKLFPSDKGGDLVCSASHNEFCLDINGDQIETLTREQVVELTRCGVMFHSEHDCLFKFS